MADDEQTQENELDRLLRKLVDDSLTDDEFQRLSAIMAESETAQLRYLNYVQMHTELAHRWGTSEFSMAELDSVADQASVNRLNQSPEPTQPAWKQWMMIAAVFLLGIGVSWLWNNRQQDPSGNAVTRSDIPTNPIPDSDFVRQTSQAPPVDSAVVVRADNVGSAELQIGSRLKPGLLKVNQGIVQLEFMSGALVAIQGPAELKVESKDLATLISGKAVAHCPRRARGFVLNAPHAAVVDLGTEFSINIDQDGVAEVGLISGEVELSLLGDDGATLVSKRITEIGRVRVDQEASSLTSLGKETGVDLPTILRTNPTPFDPGDDYVTQVTQDSPFLYWRFEESGQQTVANEMGDDYKGRLMVDQSADDSGLRIADGYAQFDRVETNRFITAEHRIKDLNESEFSIEVWVRPDDLQHSTCLGVVPEPNVARFAHLNVIEVITDSFLIHEPGAFRFLHRNPPSHDYSGTNLFSPGLCTPGKWHHVVAIKSENRLKLFLDGKILKDVGVKDHNGTGNFNIIVGQLKPFVLERQFSGGIDELAIYQRALLESEVARHYELAVN